MFEDHFYNESSLANWDQSYENNGAVYWSPAQGGSLFIRDGGMSIEAVCPDRFCAVFDDTLALLNRESQWRNFELTVKLKSYTYEWNVPESRIILRTQRFAWLDAEDAAFSLQRGQGYAVQLTASTPAPQEAIPFPLPFGHVSLIRQDCPSTITCSQQTVATASFTPLFLPMDVRLVMNEGSIQVFLNGKKAIAYDDPSPIPAAGIGLGDNGAFVSFDDIVIKDRLNLRFSADTMLNGKDPVCSGGLFKKPTWVHLWPPDAIKQVDFYLDGNFRRTERFPPWELDGGKSARLSTGPHEVRAEIGYQNGHKATLRASFDVGERPPRCSADATLDGKDPSCNGLNFDKPMWVYWWPESGVKSVDFYLNHVLHRIERIAPYELDGGRPHILNRSGTTATSATTAPTRSARWLISRTGASL